MYTTIEPRLIALLNDPPPESFTASPSLELPPLQASNTFKASGRPLLLEPDASTRNGKPSSNGPLGAQHSATLIAPIEEEEKGHEHKQKPDKNVTDRALGSSSPQSLRKILDDDASASTGASSKKRLIAENSKDDFVQLPQPPKKQKAAKQVVPPIIIGLFEPPPQATLFPPIASSSFHDSHGRNTLNIFPTSIKEVKDTSKSASPESAEKNSTAVKNNKKRKDVRARKRWTEEETNNLLLGVYKHGVGNWTDILEDPSFSFNQRSGADLKDRFRTCCPAELRGNTSNGNAAQQPEGETGKAKGTKGKSKSSLMSENILIDDEDTQTSQNADGGSSKARKSRAHRRKLEDLAQLGIEGPFRKSHRRERRPFTEDEDREILQGYNIHGPAWTRIQRDPQFHLQSRQPTDLRDRFRNKYPEKFRAEDKDGEKEKPASSTAQAPSLSHPTNRKEKEKENSDPNLAVTSTQSSTPSIQSGKGSNERGKENMVVPGPHNGSHLQSFSSREGLRIQEIISSENDVSKSMPLQPQNSLFNFKDHFGPFSEQQPIESTDNLPFSSQPFDWGGPMAAPFSGNIGEMDISRLLLDETWIDNPNSSGKEKQSFTEINSIVTSNAENHSGPSFFHLLADTEPIVDLHESPFG